MALLSSYGASLQDGLDAIRIETRLRVEVHRIFRALTIAEYVELWASPLDGVGVRCEIDVRVNGGFAVQACAPGHHICFVSGRFLEVQSSRKLVFSWQHSAFPGASRSKVSLGVTERGAETVLTLAHTDLDSAAQRAMADAIWRRCFRRLAELFDLPAAIHSIPG